jgi:hypothetical protein
MDKETFLKTLAALAAIIAALVGTTVGFYFKLKEKDYELKIQKRKDKDSHLRKYYVPLLRFSYELDRRLGHILLEIHSDWLSGTHLKKISKKEGFALDPNEKGYFIISTVYMLACFFGWTEAIKRGVDTTKPFPEKENIYIWYRKFKSKVAKLLFLSENKKNVFIFDPDISRLSKIFQYKEMFNEYMTTKKFTSPTDASKLHKQFQYSIGELMLEDEDTDTLRCKSFREFFDTYQKDENFRYWFILLENLIVDLCDFEKGKDIETQCELKNDIRPLRILAIRYWLRVLMKNMSKELEIETLSPDEVLEPVSTQLKKAIKSVEIEKLESYLLGIKIYN